MKEIWEPLKDFEDCYLISTHGRVMAKTSKKIRKPWITRKGYLRLSLSAFRQKTPTSRNVKGVAQ